MMDYANTLSAVLLLALLVGASACSFQSSKEPRLQLAKADDETTSLKHAKQMIDQGKPAEAITAFRALLRVDGPSLPIMNGLAIAHAELGRLDIAADFFAKALALSPGDPATLNNIGYAALRRRETSLARRYLEMALQAGNETPEISGNLNVLERLEVRSAPVITDTLSWSNKSAGNMLVVQRTSASTVRLARLQPSFDEPSTRLEMPVQPNTTLIDFNEFFDPWPTDDHPSSPAF